jgi:hypothetical protein
MSQLPFRQVARFEQPATAYLKRRQQGESSLSEFSRGLGFRLVAAVSCLALYGEPKIDEPLLRAWERCRQSNTWQACRAQHGGFDNRGGEDGTPFERWGMRLIVGYFMKHFLPDLPGADKIEKFSRIFKKSPPWLLWFTHADVAARALGIGLPDLSKISRFARGEPLLTCLPRGPFELHPRPDGVDDEFMPGNEESFEDKIKYMTPRARKRMRRIYETLR